MSEANNLLVLSAADVRRLLPMGECIDVMERAMLATSAGKVSFPPRVFVPVADGNATFGLMPGSNPEPPAYGAKIISLHPGNPDIGLPMIQGFVVLFDYESGVPSAMMEGATITGIRTAAASGLATRVLARADARTHGIFGTGVQAVTHIDAVASARDIDTVVVWGRNADKAKAFADEQSARTGSDIRATADPEEAAACDVISAVTDAPEPILKGAWVKPGAHVNLVGSHSSQRREADSDLVAAARVYVDYMESAMNEGGDIVIPLEEGRISTAHILGEIGQCIAGDVAGRQTDTDITLYKSLGIVAQDLFAAEYIYRQAQQQGAGSSVEFS